jgi:predicted tellurium resistance membrane protein TerC
VNWFFSLVTLTAMEVVLGVDNIIFLTLLVGRLPVSQREIARKLGLAVALGTRLLLLLALFWIVHTLVYPLFRLSSLGVPAEWLPNAEVDEVSWRDLILIGGGTFLIAKSTWELHANVEGEREKKHGVRHAGFVLTLVEIGLLDIVFSLDSVITALGMTDERWVMIVAMLVAVGIMMIFAGSVGRFVDRHPTVKVLALSFLILIGVMLVAEGFGQHINRGYIYFAMCFALVVELLNQRIRPPAPPKDAL